MKKTILIMSLLFAQSVFSARVAVVDSGTDFQHSHLAGRQLVNLNEIPGNYVDDDGNGKVDDILGWNIANGYGKIFAREHLSFVQERVYKLMNIVAKIQSGSVTKEEKEYFDKNLRNLPDVEKQQVISELNYFGQYAHGTHVAGTVVNQSPEAKVMAVRIFPDTPPDVNLKFPVALSVLDDIKGFLYGLLASFANGTFKEAGAYINERSIDVANLSVGVPLGVLAKTFLKLTGNSNPTREEIVAEANLLYSKYEEHGKQWLASAPNTLFVIAAGNDGENNDELPTFPSNVPAENKISVAASHGFDSIAAFSSYGKNTVDIAAPGVAEVSSVPHLNSTEMMPMSGTSMASPYIAGVAARVKDQNPKLAPKDIKKILMETVDKKEWLVGKVRSAGTINPERAVYAASLTVAESLTEAIQQSFDKHREAYKAAGSATNHQFNTVVPSQEDQNLANQFVY